MNEKVDPIAAGHHTLTPQITVKDCLKAIEFYKKAFGAEMIEAPCAMPDGRIGHAELKIGDSRLMLNDEFPEMGAAAPQGKTTSASVYVYVADVDMVFKGAVALGAKVVKAVENQFWGDRQGTLTDPFGHQWSLATHVEDVTPALMKERMEKLFAVGAK
ncbi:MAG TPA: VOC family protein [Elusimicrobiota bacterium]|jgi:PhnB protein|nr:VOC family protein [Elusimicrobiota bacterium]